jgi:REP element-mobilizing transposase RayT
MHGAADGSADRRHNRYGAPLAKENQRLFTAELRLMGQPGYQMDEPRRHAVLEGIIHRCNQADWSLIAAHVRTNHVHIIVQAENLPEFLMTRLKSAASRCLNERGFDDKTRKRWARHGSTRTLFDHDSVREAIRYVLDSQGDVMSTYRG